MRWKEKQCIVNICQDMKGRDRMIALLIRPGVQALGNTVGSCKKLFWRKIGQEL